jgi:hypothetical protein
MVNHRLLIANIDVKTIHGVTVLAKGFNHFSKLLGVLFFEDLGAKAEAKVV